MKNTNTVKKKTPIDYDIIPLIKNRYSPRVFSDMPLTAADLHSLLEAGRWTPSSYNMQPWRIIWGTKGSQPYDRIFDCLDPFNQKWAFIARFFFITAYKKTTPEGKENFHALYDLGLFVGNVTLQASHMGIALHQMAGLNFEKAKKEFKLPDDCHVATAIAFGYYGGDPTILSEDLEKMETKEERVRMLQLEFTFNGNYIQKAEVKKKE